MHKIFYVYFNVAMCMTFLVSSKECACLSLKHMDLRQVANLSRLCCSRCNLICSLANQGFFFSLCPRYSTGVEDFSGSPKPTRVRTYCRQKTTGLQRPDKSRLFFNFALLYKTTQHSSLKPQAQSQKNHTYKC